MLISVCCGCSQCWTVSEDFDSGLPSATIVGNWQAVTNADAIGFQLRTDWSTDGGQLIDEQFLGQGGQPGYTGVFCLNPDRLTGNWPYLAVQSDVIGAPSVCPSFYSVEEDGSTRAPFTGGFGIFLGGVESGGTTPTLTGNLSHVTFKGSWITFEVEQGNAWDFNECYHLGTRALARAGDASGTVHVAFSEQISIYPCESEAACSDRHTLRFEVDRVTSTTYDVRFYLNDGLVGELNGIEFDWVDQPPVGVFHNYFGGRYDNLCITTCRGPKCPLPPEPCIRCLDDEGYRTILPCVAYCAALKFEVGNFADDGCSGCSSLDGTYTIPAIGEFGACASSGPMPTGVTSPCNSEDEVTAEWSITTNCTEGEDVEPEHFVTISFTLNYGSCSHTWQRTIEGDEESYGCSDIMSGVSLSLSASTGDACCTPPETVAFSVVPGDCEGDCDPEIEEDELVVLFITGDTSWSICLHREGANWSGSGVVNYPSCDSITLTVTLSCARFLGSAYYYQLEIRNDDTGESSFLEVEPFDSGSALPASASGSVDNICGTDLALVADIDACNSAVAEACCPDWGCCGPPTFVVNETWNLGGDTVSVSGTLSYDSVNDKWVGTLLWEFGCVGNPDVSWTNVEIACDGGTFELSYDPGSTPLEIEATAVDCDNFTLTFPVETPVLCDTSTETVDLEFVGQ